MYAIRESLIPRSPPLASKIYYPIHFYATICSSALQSLYLDDSIVAFTVELAQPIELGPSDIWEVRLCELSYHPNHVGVFKTSSVIGGNTIFIYTVVISQQYVVKFLVHCLRTFTHPSSKVIILTIISITCLSKN